MKQVTVRKRWIPLVFLSLLLGGCPGGGGGGVSDNARAFVPLDCKSATAGSTVRISWTASRETAVNTAGGGYRVYQGTTRGSAATTGTLVATNASALGSPAVTSADLTMSVPGTYYVAVRAYSALNPPGGSAGSTSAPSAEACVNVQ